MITFLKIWSDHYSMNHAPWRDAIFTLRPTGMREGTVHFQVNDSLLWRNHISGFECENGIEILKSYSIWNWMNRLHNKHGPTRGMCLHLIRHARDGIGSDGSARDATILTACDEMAEMLWQRSGRMPRDATIIAESKWNYRFILPGNHNLIYGRIRRKIRFRWRNMMPENRPSGPVQGEVCPDSSRWFMS